MEPMGKDSCCFRLWPAGTRGPQGLGLRGYLENLEGLRTECCCQYSVVDPRVFMDPPFLKILLVAEMPFSSWVV